MSNNKHTPGPWVQYPKVMYGEKDETYRTIEAGKAVFNHNGDIDLGFCITGFISKSNAQIISAAPEMYEALKYASQVVCNHEDGNKPEFVECLEWINKAIAKAEGRKVNV